MAKALLARGADVNLVNKFPVQSGRGGPNVSSDRSNYGSALHLAAARDNMAMMQLLLTNRADVALRNIFGETALHVAAASGRTDVVALLVVAGADVNATGAEDQTGGATPLHLAIVGGYREVAKLLLESGANPNTTIVAGSPGRTPLIQAAFGKDAELIALLLNYKANPNAIDTQGYFALLNAVLARNAKTTRVLLAGGANPDMLTTDGYPLLKLAVTDSASKEVVQELIEAKANVNASDPNGWTPLHWAASGNRKELVELLVKAGADVNLRDKQGKTPLDYVKGNIQPVGSIVWKQSPRPGMTTPVSSPVSAGEAKLTPDDMALLLRQHGALDELPDFTRIRITRQGLVQPHVVFVQGTTTTNRFTLLETLMRFYKIDSVYWETKGALAKASAALQFPDFGRIIIHRPSPKLSGKEQEIKISLLDGAGALDCAKDVAVAFGDVIEVPERVHALNAALDDPVNEMEAKFGNAKRVADEIRASTNAGLSKDHPTMVQFAKQKADADAAVENVACLRKSVQLVIAGKATPLLVDSWKEGFLSQALTKMEARSALRSSSDLSRTQVKRKDAKTGKQVVLIVDARDVNDSLWLHEGDVIEVPDKP